MAKTHDVRGDASAVRLQAFEGSAPLEAVQRIPVNKQGRESVTALYVGDTTDRKVGELPRCVKGLRVDRFCVRVCCVGRRSRQERGTGRG